MVGRGGTGLGRGSNGRGVGGTGQGAGGNGRGVGGTRQGAGGNGRGVGGSGLGAGRGVGGIGRGSDDVGRGAHGTGVRRGADGIGRGADGTSLRRGAGGTGLRRGAGCGGLSQSGGGGGSGEWGTRGTRSVYRPRAGIRGGSRGGSHGGSGGAIGRSDQLAHDMADLDDALEGLGDFEAEPLENGSGLNHVDNGLGRGRASFNGGTSGLNRGGGGLGRGRGSFDGGTSHLNRSGGGLGRGGTRRIESASRSLGGSPGGIRSGSRGGSSSAAGCGDEFADDRADLNDILDEGFDDLDSETIDQNGRGSNHVDSLPNHPDQRTWIYPLGHGFTNVRVNRQIIAILKTMFNGPWTTWREVPDDDRTTMWERFCGLYQWESSFSAIVERNWEFILKKRFSNTLSIARKYAMAKAVAATGTSIADDDFEVLKPYHPKWIDAGDWEIMIDTLWNTDGWKKKSKTNTENKATLVDGEIPKHTSGSVSFDITKHRMEKKKGRGVTSLEWYTECHTKKVRGEGITPHYVTEHARDVAETYERLLLEKFGPDTTNHPPIGDLQLWEQACGGMKKGRLPGFADPDDPSLAVTGTPSLPHNAPSYDHNMPSIVEVERLSTQLEERNKQAEEREKAAADCEKKMQASMEMIEEELERQQTLRQEMEDKVKEFNEMMSRYRKFPPPN